jgi:hypothetical protein
LVLPFLEALIGISLISRFAHKAGLNAAAGQSSSRSLWEYALFGGGLVATAVVTVWVTRIARRELTKSDVNHP